MIPIERRYYTEVGASEELTDSYIIPNGQTLYLSEIGGDAALSSSVKVEIYLDTELIFATHSSHTQKTTKSLLGNGVKSIDTILKNDTESSETIGGYWLGILE